MWINMRARSLTNFLQKLCNLFPFRKRISLVIGRNAKPPGRFFDLS